MDICPECSTDVNLFPHAKGCSLEDHPKIDVYTEIKPATCRICGRMLVEVGNPSMSVRKICPIHSTAGAP